MTPGGPRSVASVMKEECPSRVVGLADWFDPLGGLTPIEGHLHRSPIPFTSDHMRQLQAGGIQIVYSMEEAVPGPLLLRHGFDWRPHFWTDDAPPTHEQMRRFLDDYLAVPPDVPVLVHCKAGWGRTGSAIACALMARHGWTAQRALEHFWARVPRARSVMIGNGQAEFVHGFAASLRGRGLDAPADAPG